MQYDKHNDELSLQGVSDPVIDALKETKHLLKTDLTEIRGPWLANNHEKIDKPLFVTMSKKWFVFATDDFYNTAFFFSQLDTRKLNFIRKGREGLSDNPKPSTPVDISKAV